MTTGNEDYGRHSPDVLLQMFSRSRMVFWGAVAVGIHVLVLCVTSTGYIRDLFDPEGAEARKAKAAVEAEAETAILPAQTNAPGPGEEAAPTTAATGRKARTQNGDDEVMIDGVAVPTDRTNSAIIKAITSTAKPEELPRDSDLGITLDDTRL